MNRVRTIYVLKFWVKTGIACFLIIIAHILVPIFFAGDKTDPFYRRFTSPRQVSLILGTSRAAQGLHPGSFDEAIRLIKLDGPIYNFSFTVVHSPYGPVYLNAIKQKLLDTSTNGLFILSVDPFSLGRNKKIPDNAEQFNEQNLCLGNMVLFNHPVNYEYLLKNYPHYWGNLVISSVRSSPQYVLPDGRLHVTTQDDSTYRATRTLHNIRSNKKEEYILSETRFKYLEEIIDYLKTKGKVVLVRLPVGSEMMEVENKTMPDFNARISGIASVKGIPYFDYTDQLSAYATRDGDHLLPKSGKRVSDDLADKIVDTFIQSQSEK